jgi:hypothetical protein
LELIDEVWSKQDGAVGQTCWECAKCLSAKLHFFGGIAWPSSSPDLTALNIFLMCCLKYEFCHCKLCTIMEIKEDIIDDFNAINAVFC